MWRLFELGYTILITFRDIVSFFMKEIDIPLFTSEFWSAIDGSFVGSLLDRLPWAQAILDYLMDVLPSGVTVTLFDIMLGSGLVVYIILVFLKFFLRILKE